MAVYLTRLILSTMFVTKNDIAQDFNHRFLIKAACISFPILVAIATAHIVDRERATRRYRFTPFIFSFVLGSFVNFLFIAELIIHFGLPTMLTFGHQVGKIVPPSCEGSVPIEGPNGWPCWLVRLREWTVLYLSGQDGYDVKEFQRMWLGIWATVVVEFCCVVVLPVVLVYVESREQGRKTAKVDVEKAEKLVEV